jgi:hypothetical protein
MTTRTRRWIRGAFAIVAGLTLAAGTAGAQSQAVNGTIEGTNIFNIVQISSVRTGVQVDAAGNVLTPLVFGTTPSGLTSVSDERDGVPADRRLRAAEVPARIQIRVLTGWRKAPARNVECRMPNVEC